MRSHVSVTGNTHSLHQRLSLPARRRPTQSFGHIPPSYKHVDEPKARFDSKTPLDRDQDANEKEPMDDFDAGGDCGPSSPTPSENLHSRMPSMNRHVSFSPHDDGTTIAPPSFRCRPRLALRLSSSHDHPRRPIHPAISYKPHYSPVLHLRIRRVPIRQYQSHPSPKDSINPPHGPHGLYHPRLPFHCHRLPYRPHHTSQISLHHHIIHWYSKRPRRRTASRVHYGHSNVHGRCIRAYGISVSRECVGEVESSEF